MSELPVQGTARPPSRSQHRVAALSEVPPSGRKIVQVAGKSIGLFNVNGVLRAVLNVCPHEHAPVCLGRVGGTTLPSAPGEYLWGREGEILACPWHGWEFDLLTGECLTDRRRLRLYDVQVQTGQCTHSLNVFDVRVENEDIYVTL